MHLPLAPVGFSEGGLSKTGSIYTSSLLHAVDPSTSRGPRVSGKERTSQQGAYQGQVSTFIWTPALYNNMY